MSVVEIDRVTLDEARAALLAHGLDLPRPGQASAFYGVDVRGWAVGRRRQAESAVVRNEGTDLRRAAVNGERPDVAERFPENPWSGASGFLAPVGALKLAQRFDLEVHVRLADGTEARIAVLSGRRSPLRTQFEPAIQPLCLTALGRTGSTAVARLLASHPRIAAYRPFEYEPRVVSYWIDVLKELSEPVSFRRQITPLGPLKESWWIGASEPFPRRIRDDDVQAWIGGESSVEIAAFCQGRIETFYTRVAERFDRPGAEYFLEKLGPETGMLVRELYPSAREIFLVRDFRDMIASIFAFNRKRGFQGFGRDRAASDEEYVSEWISESVASFVQAWRSRSEGAHLVRYEDLVLRPRETLLSVLEYLELDTPPRTVDEMLESLDAPQSDVHRTTAAEASIGRWRRDLPDDLKEACERVLGGALDEFGYAS
jgi:Sulfotransferase family